MSAKYPQRDASRSLSLLHNFQLGLFLERNKKPLKQDLFPETNTQAWFPDHGLSLSLLGRCLPGAWFRPFHGILIPRVRVAHCTVSQMPATWALRWWTVSTPILGDQFYKMPVVLVYCTSLIFTPHLPGEHTHSSSYFTLEFDSPKKTTAFCKCSNCPVLWSFGKSWDVSFVWKPTVDGSVELGWKCSCRLAALCDDFK